MTIPPLVRACFLVPFATACLLGCNSNQGQLLALRDECQRQMQVKDKTIEEQTQKLADLRAQVDQLQLQTAKTAIDPDKLASAVAEAVSKQLAQQDKTLAELKKSVDQLSQGGGIAQSGKSSGGGAAAPGPAAESGVPSKPTVRPTAPREVSSSSDHPGAIKEKFEFPK